MSAPVFPQAIMDVLTKVPQGEVDLKPSLAPPPPVSTVPIFSKAAYPKGFEHDPSKQLPRYPELPREMLRNSPLDRAVEAAIDRHEW